MSEATPEAGTPGTPPEPTPAPTPAPPAQEPDWKTEARKWEERSKGNKSALDELTAKYQALETQHNEVSGKLQTYETEKERAELVASVAEAKGVPAAALRGSTREELEAHADTLAELIKPSGPVIPGQEQTPNKVGDNPMREFTRNLFASAND
jgi:hypothetical protein